MTVAAKPLLAFHGDKKIKAKYVARLCEHHKADELIKGTYWQQGKGCAVGCTIHSDKHAAYETELGLPEWLAGLEDRIFEGLPNGQAKDFARDFLEAIPVGANLEPVKWQFCSLLIQENLDRVAELKLDKALKERVLKAMHQCKGLHDSAIATGKWDESAAARSAARSAESAARSAESAAAESAAYIRYAKALLELLRKAA